VASKRRIRRNACTGKVRHASAHDGQTAIGKLVRGKGWQGTMNVYQCPFCHAWHIGHAPRNGALRRR
jgi:hypothetical protein